MCLPLAIIDNLCRFVVFGDAFVRFGCYVDLLVWMEGISLFLWQTHSMIRYMPFLSFKYFSSRKQWLFRVMKVLYKLRIYDHNVIFKRRMPWELHDGISKLVQLPTNLKIGLIIIRIRGAYPDIYAQGHIYEGSRKGTKYNNGYSSRQKSNTMSTSIFEFGQSLGM